MYEKISRLSFWQRDRISKEKTDRDTKEILERLYPGEGADEKYRELRSRKYALMLTIIIIGIVSAVCMHLSSRMHGSLEEGTRLYRNEWGEGNYFITLSAETQSGTGELYYEVSERLFTKQEAEELKKQAKEELLQVILGDNESLTSVNKDLILCSRLEGYPFSIAWKSSNYERVRKDGRVNTQNLPLGGESILLTAIFSYNENSWEEKIEIKLTREILSTEQKYFQAIKELLTEADKDSECDNEICLPEKIGNEVITWKEKKTDNSFLMILLGFVGALLAAWGTDRDLQKKNRLRKEEIIKSYPEFVSRLQLYMGAGLTSRNAFLKVGRDYKKEKEKTGKKVFLYEEVLISNNRFLNGKAEDKVYQEWGRRCGEMQCRKLGFLLASHLKQGNDRLLSMLSRETELALEEKRNRAKKQGEEVGTKLLFPMIMMLMVVMFLILLPAFTGFGKI